MSSSQKNHSQNTIQAYCIAGLAKKLSSLFSYLKPADEKFSVNIISSTDRYQHLSEIRNNNVPGTRNFPYGFLTLENISDSIESGYNNKALSRHFFSLALSQDSNLLHQLRVMPKQFDLTFTMLLDNYYDVLGALGTWSFLEKDKSANFDLKFAGLTFSIQVTFMDSAPMPLKENAVEQVNFYELIFNCQLKGYLSQPIPLTELPTKTKIQQIHINGYSITNSQLEELEPLDYDDANGVLIRYEADQIIEEKIILEDYL